MISTQVVPLASGLVVETLRDSLPEGLVNLLQGDGDVGAKLTGHPNVDMVGFTGSTATGQKILNTASKTLKPVVLECGGKDPMVVLEDADLELAAKDAVAYSLANCGQVCCAVERVYVAASVAALDATALNALAWDGRGALHVAASGGRAEACHALLARPDFTEVRSCFAFLLSLPAPLVLFCFFPGGHLATQANATTEHGSTALHFALVHGHAAACPTFQ